MRADVFLALHGLAESRTRARFMIESGAVTSGGRAVRKASEEIAEGADVQVVSMGYDYVGRGAYKLRAALDAFGVSVAGKTAVDIGASTGGFTELLLMRGAEKVYAVDVGRGQLHERLKNDSRVVSMENFNARELDIRALGGEADLAVMDVSFISQTLILPAIRGILTPGGFLISLIKPQFELSRAEIGKGVVHDREKHIAAIERVKKAAIESGLSMEGLIKSPVAGGDGNTEYLGYFTDGDFHTVDSETIKKTVYGDETGSAVTG